MSNQNWIESLSALLHRAEGQGMTFDLTDMDLGELWGLYCYLRRILED